MNPIVGRNFDVLYRKTLWEVMRLGRRTAPRGMETTELLGVQLKLWDSCFNLLRSPARKMNPSFMAAEFLWMMMGRNDPASIAPFNNQIAKFAELDYFRGAYGPKLLDQLGFVLDTLIADPDSRQAVLTIWRERPGKTKDMPCTSLMQFFAREGQLHAVVYMRSNDAWLGLPYDLFNFTMIQNYIAGQLGLYRGSYTHNVGSLHIYEPDFEKARAVVQEEHWDHEKDIESPNLPKGRIPLLVEERYLGLAQPGEFYGDVGRSCGEYGDLLRLVALKKQPNMLDYLESPGYKEMVNESRGVRRDRHSNRTGEGEGGGEVRGASAAADGTS